MDPTGRPHPFAYIIQTDVFARRMQDVSTRSGQQQQFGGIECFGEIFPADTPQRALEIMKEVRKCSAQPEMAELRAALAPDLLSRNPLFVWCAAVLENMIAPDEFEVTARFVKENIPEMNKPVNPLAMHGSDWLDVLFDVVDEDTTRPLTAFAKHFGFIYEFEETDTSSSS